MIFGAHVILDSTNPSADRAFLRDVLGFSAVDAVSAVPGLIFTDFKNAMNAGFCAATTASSPCNL